MTTEYVDGVTLADHIEAGSTPFPVAIEYVSQVLAAPGCTIEAVTTAEAEGGPGTAYLRERSVVRAPRLLLGYMAGQAEDAHRLTMQRLPEVLARAT